MPAAPDSSGQSFQLIGLYVPRVSLKKKTKWQVEYEKTDVGCQHCICMVRNALFTSEVCRQKVVLTSVI